MLERIISGLVVAMFEDQWLQNQVGEQALLRLAVIEVINKRQNAVEDTRDADTSYS